MKGYEVIYFNLRNSFIAIICFKRNWKRNIKFFFELSIVRLARQNVFCVRILHYYPLYHNAAGPAYYVLHPQKGITICVLLTYQAFKNREGFVSRKIFLKI